MPNQKQGLIAQGKRVESTIDFTRFIKEFKKHWWKILLIVALVAALCYPLIQKLTPVYVSTATVLIKAQADNATPIDKVDGYDSTRNEFFETQYTLMNTRIILQRAVIDLKLDQNPDFNGETTAQSEDEKTQSVGEAALENQSPEQIKALAAQQLSAQNSEHAKVSSKKRQQRIDAAIKEVNKNLTITGVRLTQLAYVSYESADKAMAAKIANGVAQAFIDYTMDQKTAKTRQAQAWNERRMQELKQDIIEKKAGIQKLIDNEGLLTFRGIDGFETETLGIVTNKLADARDRRIQYKAEYDVISRYLGKPLSEVITSTEISNHAQIQDLRIALITARKELYDLSKRYGPKHKKILEAKARIQAINEQTNLVLRELQTGLYKKYQSALDKENQYKKQLEQQKQVWRDLVLKRDKYDDLKTDLDETTSLYKTIYKRSQELELTSRYQEPDAILYDPAHIAEKPSKPNKSLFLVMIVMLVLIFCIVALIIKAALNNRIQNLSQVKSRLGLEPLGELIHFNWLDGDMQRSMDTSMRDIGHAELVHGIRSNILLAESIRNESLNNSHEASVFEWQVMAMASTGLQEGRSSLAYLLASSFSQGQKTLLIDLDFRQE
ncbi:MAG: GumC family protein, partial [Vibrio sp.]